MQLLNSRTMLFLLPPAFALPGPSPFPLPSIPKDLGSTGANWPACQTNLSCDFLTIEGAPLQDRLDYIRAMQSQFFGPQLNCPTQWRNIEGVIQFFLDKGLGATGTWVSYTDAGIIEAVQRGGAIALGMSSDDGGNPGAQPWADFMRAMKAGTLGDRPVSFRSVLRGRIWFGRRLTSSIWSARCRRMIMPGPWLSRPAPTTGGRGDRMWG